MLLLLLLLLLVMGRQIPIDLHRGIEILTFDSVNPRLVTDQRRIHREGDSDVIIVPYLSQLIFAAIL